MASKAQLGLLKKIKRWGELSMDAEHAAGCHGAAFNRVLDSLYRRNWIEGDQSAGLRLTAAGCAELRA